MLGCLEMIKLLFLNCVSFAAKGVDGYVKPQIKQVVPE